MIPRRRMGLLSWILLLSFFFKRFAESRVAQEEVDVLQQIVTTMGARYWKFNADSCQVEAVWATRQHLSWSETSVGCDCSNGDIDSCHVISIVLKGLSLPGVLPPQLSQLPYIQHIDIAYNYLSGTIPTQWASTKLNCISVLVNRLSGEIPKALGNITSLNYLNLEGNQFSGVIPSEIGNLVNLKTLMLSSNRLVGSLPTSFSALVNLQDFRISDNNFSGPIPNFMQNWKQLTRLEMQASGLEGPIPRYLSLLENLTNLRISDINGPSQGFPLLRKSTGLVTLILRNCNISGEIPSYIWSMKYLQLLDVSFNKLVGGFPDFISARSALKFLFLTGNVLIGNIPKSILVDGINIDLSYNNFTWQGVDEPACQPDPNLHVNLYKSFSRVSALRRTLPCAEKLACPRYVCSININCGGNDVTVKESGNREVEYEGDAGVEGGSASRYFISSGGNDWGFSSTGDFMDDGDVQNTRFVVSQRSTNLPELYSSARISPLSLTYFGYCLENGKYNVSLHFAEIVFRNDSTYLSLGRRVFDIYIQDKLVWKRFNIEEEAQGAQRPVIRHFNASVIDNTLEIRLYWAGKGTTRIPLSGHYGPLISAISVNPYMKSCLDGTKKHRIIYSVVGAVSAVVFFILGLLWWNGYLQCRGGHDPEVESQMVTFTLKQIKVATNNFDASKKIGEGGFGPVYKGRLSDGTLIAVKQLSSKSRQGNKEFLNEMGMFSCLQHPNVVKLYGGCVEGDQLLLVYEYMENNSLANVLFKENELVLDWSTRLKICIGIARGLTFLHEESSLRIVHRDVKATNVLLDGDMNPKISDFGLARLNEDDKSHISTRIAGTVGYMAPEYALWGHLTYKADVYSFGIVLLEVVSGKSNNNFAPIGNCVCLLDWACFLLLSGKAEEMADEKLGSDVNKEKVEGIVKVALLCTSATPSLRPTMSEALGMLEGRIRIPDELPEASTYTEDVRLKAIQGLRRERQSSHSGTGNFAESSSSSSQNLGASVESGKRGNSLF